jgi:hypothetical protein
LGSSDSSKTSDIDNDGGGDNPVPKEAKAKERRQANENYEMFDDCNEEMDIEHYGKGSYSGGVHESEWNTWQ